MSPVGSRARRDNLIIDVGMHHGEDATRFIAGGYTVVGVEANPALVESVSARCAAEISDGRLAIVGSAIATDRGTARMGIADMSIWSSLDPQMIARNERSGSSYRYIEVPTLPFEDVLAEYGVPHYLKVDIEGYDMLCIRALRHFAERPMFVSLESSASTNQAPMEAVFDEVAELWSLGYRRFRYLEQRHGVNAVPRRSSWEGPPWRTAWAALAQAQMIRANHNLGGMGGRWATTPVGRVYKRVRRAMGGRESPWYDLHAALAEPIG